MVKDSRICYRTASCVRISECDKSNFTQLPRSLSSYEFIVLPNAWAITEPSFPTGSSESQAYGFFSQTDVYVRRFEFISELMQNYKLGPCEQTEDTMEEDSIDDAR